MNFFTFEESVVSLYPKEECPVLTYQREKWSKQTPLKDLIVLDCTPVFKNTLVKHLALITAGAKLYVGISDVMPFDREAVEYLLAMGIPVVRPDERNVIPDLVLDCAGVFSSWIPTIGSVELTRSGVQKYIGKKKPVYLADSGRIKQIETCLGTGESYFRAMSSLGYDDWNDRRLIVFGSGKVGTGIVTYAHRKGAEVIVVTDMNHITDSVREKASAIVDYRKHDLVRATVENAYAVVTATGIANALEHLCLRDIISNSTVLLTNMGVEDEYGPSIPTSRVLANKKTLNFILEEPTRMRYIDATMALHNEGACHLSENPLVEGIIIPPAETEEQLLTICREKGLIGKELEWI